MSNDTWGIFESIEDALYWIRQSEGKKDGYALIADATDTRYKYIALRGFFIQNCQNQL